MSLVLSILAGLLAGAGHVIAGPDHLAAIGPLAVDGRRTTWRIGLLWGVGHCGGVWILALLALVLREALPIDVLSTWGERIVGFVLVGIGLWGVCRLAGTGVHCHAHTHDGVAHVHVHLHRAGRRGRSDHRHTHSALGIGTLHGVAGSAHLVGVLPGLLLPTRIDAVAYVGAFGLGAVVAMTLFCWLLGELGGRLRRFRDGPYRAVCLGSSLAAITVGCVWCYRTLRGGA